MSNSSRLAVGGEFELAPRDFARIRHLIHAEAGIALGKSKAMMAAARLAPLVRQGGHGSYQHYLDALEGGESPGGLVAFINALTTNLTRFYREEHHFDHLCAQVGRLMEHRHGRERRLRIWSAGCSSGQEPYTIALELLAAYPALREWDFRILATDIDTNMLDEARRGIYRAADVARLPPARRARFVAAGPDTVAVPSAARAVVAFKTLNLVGPWPMRRQFDAIFCRNVVIYFDRPTQASVFGRLGAALAPGGLLYLGHSETLSAGVPGLARAGKTIYQAQAEPRRALVS